MIIDFGCNLGFWPFRRLPATTGAEIGSVLDAHGVDRAVVGWLPAVTYRNVHEGNEALAAEVGEDPRWVCFATLNPTFPGWEDDLERCATGLGTQGLKLYPNYHAYSLAQGDADALVEAAVARDWPVMVTVRLEDERCHHLRMQVGPTPVEEIAALAQRFPRGRFVLGNGSYAEIEQCFAVVGTRETVWAELGYLKSPLEAVATCVQRFGASRLLAGTNTPLMSAAPGLQKILRAPIADAEREAILGGNAARLLRAG